jgi:hypothetical protein
MTDCLEFNNVLVIPNPNRKEVSMRLCEHSLTCAVSPIQSAFENCPSALAILHNRHLTSIAKIKILARRPKLLPVRIREDILYACLEHVAAEAGTGDEDNKAIKDVILATGNLLVERRRRAADYGGTWLEQKNAQMKIHQEFAGIDYKKAVDHIQELYDSACELHSNNTFSKFPIFNSPTPFVPHTDQLRYVISELRCLTLRFFGSAYIFRLDREEAHTLAATGYKPNTFERLIFDMAELGGFRNKLSVSITFGERTSKESLDQAALEGVGEECEWVVHKIKEVFMRGAS